jgi:hypothetical protein
MRGRSICPCCVDESNNRGKHADQISGTHSLSISANQGTPFTAGLVAQTAAPIATRHLDDGRAAFPLFTDSAGDDMAMVTLVDEPRDTHSHKPILITALAPFPETIFERSKASRTIKSISTGS